MNRFDAYYYRNHSRQELEHWHERLSYFSYSRAAGGLANDFDQLVAEVRFSSEGELRSILAHLGISVREHEAAPPQPERNKFYPADEFRKFVSLIPGTRWIEQPNHCSIAGKPVFVWCDQDTVRLSISEGYDDVTQACFEAAVVVEQVLNTLPAGTVTKAAPLPPWPSGPDGCP